MDCPADDVLEQLTAGVAPESLRAHVAACSRCQDRLASLRTLDSQKTLQREGPADDALAAGVEVGPYVVSRRLGAGAMGTVYAAWDPRLEREVALKVLHLEGDLLSEARQLAKLSHPNVVTVHEVLSWRGRVVLVMEYARGATLRQWLVQAPRPLAAILEVYTQCARGLAAAHAAGIVHRDFKPDNVLVDDQGRARLLDFGLATPTQAAGVGLAGSPAYLALAQLEGAPADARSDQYAWWVSLYEGLTGRRPQDAESLSRLAEVRRADVVELGVLPRWLRAPMRRGLAVDPAHRFPSMDDAARALRRPRRAALFAVAVALLTGAVVSGVVLRPPSPCASLGVAPELLTKRARAPALAEAAKRYARGIEVCHTLAAEQQRDRADCLDQAGAELALALDVADAEPGLAPLHPRLLRRVMTADRCERAPAPRLSRPDVDRAAALESLRAQLRFDDLRQTASPLAAWEFAHAHREAVKDSGSPRTRAWAAINEGAAASALGRTADALALFQSVEAVPGTGHREQTWAALGRWLFECFAASEEQCQVAETQALRLTAELDEPWANAFMLEISARYLEVRGAEVVRAWRQLPGADFEANRALINELSLLVVTDDLRRIREALEMVRGLERPSGRLQLRVLQLELHEAIRAGDLAAAGAHLARLDALPADDAEVAQAKFDGRLRLLTAVRRFTEVLALLDRPPTGDRRGQYRRLLGQLTTFFELRSPRLGEVKQQLELLYPALTIEERAWLDGQYTRMALAEGDLAALDRVAIPPGDEVLRAWQRAVVARDAEAERAVVSTAESAPPTNWGARRVALEALVARGKLAELIDAAVALRAEIGSVELEAQVRLLEAWARWQLGQRAEACRVMTLSVLQGPLVARDRERAEALVRQCPAVGLSSWTP